MHTDEHREGRRMAEEAGEGAATLGPLPCLLHMLLCSVDVFKGSTASPVALAPGEKPPGANATGLAGAFLLALSEFIGVHLWLVPPNPGSCSSGTRRWTWCGPCG